MSATTIVLLLAAFLAFTNSLPAKAAPDEVLILGSTVSGGTGSIEASEVTAKGLVPVIVDDVTWQTMNQAQFSAYRAIVLGDATCSENAPGAAQSSVDKWGPALNGNVLIAGTDPVYHASKGGDTLTRRAIDFAVDQSGKTGAYIALSCYYETAGAHTPVPLLDALRPGGFTVTGANCYDSSHIVATHPALTGLTDADLSNWSCSVHEAFDTWPADFTVLTIAKDLGAAYTASDGTIGTPYILARGSGLRSFPLSLDPASQTHGLFATATITAQLLDGSTSAPVAGMRLVGRISTGPNMGTALTCGSCSTDSAGHVAFSYIGNSPGTDSIQVWIDSNSDGAPSAGEPQATAAANWTTIPVLANTYVALGDSFSSGEGAPEAGKFIVGSDTSTDKCHRSVNAYSYVDKTLPGMPSNYEFHACSGAIVRDFFTPFPTNHTNRLGQPENPDESHAQLDWVGSTSRLISLTIGGNDAGFASVLSDCIWPSKKSCKEKYAAQVDQKIDTLAGVAGGPDTVKALFSALREKASISNAKVVVLGYPRFFPQDTKAACKLGVNYKVFSAEDLNWINSEIWKLDVLLNLRAIEAGFQYVNVYDAFRGHELCTKNPYMNTLVVPDVNQSFHPNKQGQAALAATLKKYLP
ncbi:SGNH/GDSL hydrolase family protein [Pseudarthrobacter sp. B4EP4b]|uniref:SGNH/GDSL hydrolase family protein n=1 Tax=Pseudarthrobacter sp. B4EP4b TaxID=2590664 RepID=UPI0015EE9471|nr:SGNH/GDSL hydrolase family protein [Pseudarthrobacter sp. B4EP4b]